MTHPLRIARSDCAQAARRAAEALRDEINRQREAALAERATRG